MAPLSAFFSLLAFVIGIAALVLGLRAPCRGRDMNTAAETAHRMVGRSYAGA